MTPKAGWAGTDMVGTFRRRARASRSAFDTDTNGAALAEMRWGAAQGLASFVYLTLGTGIGGAAVVDGHVLTAWCTRRWATCRSRGAPATRSPGVCPFHGDCLEGMASGPAIAARFGRRAEELEGEDVAAAAEVVAFYLASALRGIVFTLAPERIVLGGGLSQVPGLVVRTRRALARQV